MQHRFLSKDIPAIFYIELLRAEDERCSKRSKDDVFGYDHWGHPVPQGQEGSLEGGHCSVDPADAFQRGGVGFQCVFEIGYQTWSGNGRFEGGAVGAEIQDRRITQSGEAEDEDGVKKENELQKEGLFQEEDHDKEEDRHKKEELVEEKGVVQKEDVIEEEDRI